MPPGAWHNLKPGTERVKEDTAPSPRGTQSPVGSDTKEGQIIYSKWLLPGIPELVKIHKNN